MVKLNNFQWKSRKIKCQNQRDASFNTHTHTHTHIPAKPRCATTDLNTKIKKAGIKEMTTCKKKKSTLSPSDQKKAGTLPTLS